MKHNPLKFYAAAVALIAAGSVASARQLTVDEALNAARKDSKAAVLRSSRSGSGMKLVHTEVESGLNTLYVLNRDNGGFVILSADNVAMPVLGYSDEGCYDPDNIPPAMASMLKNFSGQIAAASNAGLPEYEQPVQAKKYPAIAPLVKATWNQYFPFNNLCPSIDGDRCLTGCVITAAAQVMYYHKWPAKGTGRLRNTWAYYDAAGKHHSELHEYNCAIRPFDWDNMLDSYYEKNDDETRKHQTEQQELAVANLMYALGCGASAAWSNVATGAPVTKLLPMFLKNFNYDKSLCMVRREYFTYDEWTELLCNEFTNNGPVILEGTNDLSAGHCFLADGYDGNGLFHINWGWSGSSNGYFSCDALFPAVQGAGGSAGGYSKYLIAITGIRKPVDGSETAAYFCITGNFNPDKSTFSRSEEIDFIGEGSKISAQSAAGVTFTPGIKLVAENGDVDYIWSTLGSHTTTAWDQGPADLKCNAADFPKSGTFTVLPVVKYNDRIVDMKVTVGRVNSLKLVASEDELSFTAGNELPKLSVVNIVKKNEFFASRACNYEITVVNNGGGYVGWILPQLDNAAGEKVGYMRSQVVSMKAGETKTLEWKEQFGYQVPEGNYKLYFVDKDGNRLSGATMDIVINPEITPELTLTGAEFPDALGQTVVSGVSATKTPRTFDVDMMLKSPNFSGDLKIYLYAYGPGNSQMVHLGNKTFESRKGESVPLTMNVTIPDDYKDGAVVSLYMYYYLGSGDLILLQKENGANAVYSLYVDPEAGVELIDNEKKCAIYPNPAESAATVTAESAITGITVFSINGQQLFNIAFDGTNSSETIDVSALLPGNYLVKVNTVNGVSVSRLIKR